MRTNVTRQFRSRERKCMGTKRPGTSRVTSTTVTVAALGCSHSLQPPTWRLCQSSGSARYTISGGGQGRKMQDQKMQNLTMRDHRNMTGNWRTSCRQRLGKGSPYSITERMGVPELIPVLGSQPAADVSHKPGGRLPLLSARPTVTLATLKRAATSFAAW